MTTFLEKFKSKNKPIHISSRINPHKHWKLLLRVFLITVLVLIVLSLYLLYQIKNEQIFKVKSVPVGQKNLLKEGLLKSVTESFDQKAKKEAELKKSAEIPSPTPIQ